MAAGSIGQYGDIQPTDQLKEILSCSAFAPQGYRGAKAETRNASAMIAGEGYCAVPSISALSICVP